MKIAPPRNEELVAPLDSLMLFFAQYKCTWFPLSALTSRCITCEVCVQQCNKTPATVIPNKVPATVTWSEPLQIFFHTIVTQ